MLLLLAGGAVAAPIAPPPAPIDAAVRRSGGPQEQTVVLEVADPEAAEAWLAARGLRPTAAGPGLLQLTVPGTRLAELATAPGSQRIRKPWLASHKGFDGGTVLSEGVAPALDRDAWRAMGIDGRSARVAIVDVGFRDHRALHGVELPPNTRGDLLGLSSSHGNDVAEVVADLAPGARLLLYEFRTDVEFIAVLEELEGRVDVVVASIGFDNVWHADGTSPVSQAVDRLVRSGVVYVGAAGNEVGRYARGPLSDTDSDGILEIGGAEGVPVFSGGGTADISLRWSEPMDAPTWDLALGVWAAGDQPGRDEPCLLADERQPQAGPVEAAEGPCSGPVVQVAPILISPGAGALSALEAHVYSPNGVAGEFAISRTLTLPADASLGLAAGACEVSDDDYLETGLAELYSSRGPTDDGRTKPDLCAAGSVSTRTSGQTAFRGTSAAAPHVGGAAALLVDGEGLHGAPEAVAARLRARAVDLGEEGPDDRYGAGGLALGAPARPCRCASTSPAALWLPGALFGLTLVIRRRRGV